MIDNNIQNHILETCYNNYKSNGKATSDFIFKFEEPLRQNYFDTLDSMYENGLIKSKNYYLGMAHVALTSYGVSVAKDLFG